MTAAALAAIWAALATWDEGIDEGDEGGDDDEVTWRGWAEDMPLQPVAAEGWATDAASADLGREPPAEPVDLNRASRAALLALPAMTPARARRWIVSGRPWESVAAWRIQPGLPPVLRALWAPWVVATAAPRRGQVVGGGRWGAQVPAGAGGGDRGWLRVVARQADWRGGAGMVGALPAADARAADLMVDGRAVVLGRQPRYDLAVGSLRVGFARRLTFANDRGGTVGVLGGDLAPPRGQRRHPQGAAAPLWGAAATLRSAAPAPWRGAATPFAGIWGGPSWALPTAGANLVWSPAEPLELGGTLVVARSPPAAGSPAFARLGLQAAWHQAPFDGDCELVPTAGGPAAAACQLAVALPSGAEVRGAGRWLGPAYDNPLARVSGAPGPHRRRPAPLQLDTGIAHAAGAVALDGGYRAIWVGRPAAPGPRPRHRLRLAATWALTRQARCRGWLHWTLPQPLGGGPGGWQASLAVAGTRLRRLTVGGHLRLGVRDQPSPRPSVRAGVGGAWQATAALQVGGSVDALLARPSDRVSTAPWRLAAFARLGSLGPGGWLRPRWRLVGRGGRPPAHEVELTLGLGSPG